MMNPIEIIDKYYPRESKLRTILLTHSQMVARKAMEIVENRPELKLDAPFVYEAAMLHDIGIFLTNAPGIYCFGEADYLCHGYLGAELLRKEGWERHARVCERHTGTGITRQNVLERGLPIPPKDYLPETMEEQLVCFADKFFSKSHLEREKSVEQARKSLLKFGEENVVRFDRWVQLFLGS